MLGVRLPGVYLSAVFSLFPLALILDWLPCQSPRTYVPADGFFFNFHFCLAKSNAKDGFRVLGFLGMASASLGWGIIEYGCRRLACSAFYLRRLSLRTAFFLIFIFLWGEVGLLGVRLPRVYLCAVFSLFPLALILDWLPCQSPRAEAGSRLPAFASPPNPLSEKQC